MLHAPGKRNGDGLEKAESQRKIEKKNIRGLASDADARRFP